MRLVTPQGIVWLSYKAIRTADFNKVSIVANTDLFRSKIKVQFDHTLITLILGCSIIEANIGISFIAAKLIYQGLSKVMISEIWGKN